jgi:hypothetical protein
MTRAELQTCTRKQLVELARERKIPGWHGMRKDELVQALVLHARKEQRRLRAKEAKADTPGEAAPSTTTKRNGAEPAPARVGKRGQRAPVQAAAARNTSISPEEEVESAKYNMGIPTKDLSARVPRDLPGGYGKDRIVVMVRDPYWLHCYWELTRHAIQRAEAALAQEWHASRPILRLLHVSSQELPSSSETILRDIDIHGGCNNWYIDVNDPPRSFRIDIGYVAPSGRFYVLARSNVVSTPRAGVSDVLDENWADIDQAKADRIFAMSGGFDPGTSSLELKQLFDEKLRRPLGSPAVTSFGSGGLFGFGRGRQFWFQLDAELIVYGATEANARVTLQGEPVKLRSDGTFTVRYKLPDSRQIIPAVATSPDGVEERTIVLAVERNTKHLEPMVHENNE